MQEYKRKTRRHGQQTINAPPIRAAKTKINSPADTPTLKQALQGPNASKWTEAIQSEVQQLLKATIKPVDILSKPYLFVRTTTQLKAKRNSTDGTISKYKCRICARGDMLAGTIDPSETYSPTINSLTFSTILQLAIIFKLIRRTSDTIGAYLYQDYPINEREPLYTILERDVAIACGLDPEQYYQIVRYLYGLADAGKAYYTSYSDHMMANGYEKSKMDPCLFYRINEIETTFIMIHVDDTFICSNKVEYIEKFSEIISRKFQITLNENADDYLGIHIKQLADGSIQLLQPKLLKNLFEEYAQYLPHETLNNEQRHKINSPHRTHSKGLSNYNSSIPIDPTKYLHLLGALNYLTRSRPDIMANISFAATHSKSPTESDYMDLIHILKYLYDTKNQSLILQPISNLNALTLYCYVDASYLIHSDSKSITYLIYSLVWYSWFVLL
jgi:hypothetical protein